MGRCKCGKCGKCGGAGRWGDGEMKRWGDEEMSNWLPKTALAPKLPTPDSRLPFPSWEGLGVGTDSRLPKTKND
ncbi:MULTISPECIES: hypothetical protein [Moorena]|nr:MULTISPECIES: hypothetical protein [Moorena]NEQ14068.1 hypothetical protein [Moorena sp. SIO3E2]NEP65136.1 hypothetical protein [Moorena sp. SIO3A5]NEQ09425.1 hypothetical protein [Moorena sp. SIO4E2]NER87882.1 hypothetical protein [Moorena sp. SIO3A2]OLT67228.1 hypothetical protein BI334_21350 [Moorena producens 3L]